MNPELFRETLTSFIDPNIEPDFDEKHFLIVVNGEEITCRYIVSEGSVFVIDEAGKKIPGRNWILNNLAHLPLLARRLLSAFPQKIHFISPSSNHLPTLEASPLEKENRVTNTIEELTRSINDRNHFESTVIYITSGAGEGKTWLINEITRIRADAFSKGKSDWLMVPITLGGRHFLRFDDITVGALQNRYRFPYLYYTSFIELVKMGVIIPAFDGFEEMFVENSSGEALTAMGILVNSLKSKGSIVVAARKAYFEFENLKTQEKLISSLQGNSVGFEKFELQKWDSKQFIDYYTKRSIANPGNVYHNISNRMGISHPLLTRAVLVQKLADLISEYPKIDELIENVCNAGTEFFSIFVKGLLEREAIEKWIDRSGERDIGTPLLSIDEHIFLLSEISLSMWESNIDFLKLETLELIVEIFCETTQKDSFQTMQIKERIHGHAMLSDSVNSAQAVEFDHDDFKYYFLAESIFHHIKTFDEKSKGSIYNIFRRGSLPHQVIDYTVNLIKKNIHEDIGVAVAFFDNMAHTGIQSTFVHENSTCFLVKFLDGFDSQEQVFKNLSFSDNSLSGVTFKNINFEDCFFGPTNIDNSHFSNCKFSQCRISQLRIPDTLRISNVVFEDCKIDLLVRKDTEREYRDPREICGVLRKAGFSLMDDGESAAIIFEDDVDTKNFKKLLRTFMRTTQINERLILMKLGNEGQPFIDRVIPSLIKADIMSEVNYTGAGKQRRYKLNIPIQNLFEKLSKPGGALSVLLSGT